MAERNRYTKTMEEIKAPQSAVDKAVRAALEAERSKGENKMNKTKSNIIKIVSAAAACAVVTGGITTAVVLTKNKPGSNISGSNSFTLSVNAAEINKSAVSIGKISMTEFSAGALTEKTNYDPNSPEASMPPDDDAMENYKVTGKTVSPEMDMLLSCTGNNIKTVSYSLKGGAFLLNNVTPLEEDSAKIDDLMVYNRYAYIMEKITGQSFEELVNTDPSSIEATAFARREPQYVYSHFTVNGDEQSKMVSYYEDENGIQLAPVVIISEGAYSWDPDISGASKELMDYILTHNYGDLLKLEKAGKDTEEGRLKKAFMEEMINELSMDVKVTFEDNETESYTIQFIPGELAGEGFTMDVKARLVNVKDGDTSAQSSISESAIAVGGITIKVNDSEISENSEVPLTKLDISSANKMGMAAFSATKADDGSFNTRLAPGIKLPITIKGEDIKSVSYKVTGGVLCADSTDKLLSDGTKAAASAEEYFGYDAVGDEKLFTETAINYNDLSAVSLSVYPYSSDSELYSKDEKVKAAADIINHPKDFSTFIDILNGEAYSDELNTVLDTMINGLSIDVTMHFYDGTEMTRTIKLIPGKYITGNGETPRSKEVKAKLA